jgi:hypothetical protein
MAGLASGGLLLGASMITLGLPNLGLAGQFLSGSYPSTQSVVAFLSLVCYAVVLAAVAVAVFRGLRMAAGGGARAGASEPSPWSLPVPSSSA